MTTLQKYLAVALISFFLGLCAMYAVVHRGKDKPMPTGDADVPRHDVEMAAPVKALDKTVLEQRGAISGDTARSRDKEVLATGQVKSSDGKKTVAAVLDVKTGDTQLMENRAFSEWMARQEVGIGYGLVDGDFARAAQYRLTFVRAWRFYGTAQIEAFQVDRIEDRHPWNAMLFINYRW